MEALRKLPCLFFFFWAIYGWSQACPAPISPFSGQTNVALDATISWEPVPGIPGYEVSLGTVPGGDDILTTGVGPNASFTPPQGLPANSLVYVTITLILLNQPNIECASYSFRTVAVTTPPPCTTLTSPAQNSENVPVGSTIRWAYSLSATGYRVSIGTTPGGNDLLNDFDVGNTLSYNPPVDLPEEQTVYVTITPYNDIGAAPDCPTQSFRTGPLATLPGCATILYPLNGEPNIPLSPLIRWQPVAGATGYRVSIGTSPFDNDVLDGDNFGNVTEINVIDFEPNRIYYIRIVPYNEAGAALDCPQTSFSTLLGCGPYFDTEGNLVDLSPPITFPESVGICSGDGATALSALDPADGYRWYEIINPNREVLLVEGPDFLPPGPGEYRLEIYNQIEGPTGSFECRSSRVFSVSESAAAVIEGTETTLGAGVISIEVSVSGVGDYEFALDSPDGPYQADNRFSGLPLDSYTIYVRDRNGCGISQVLVQPDLTVEGFPKFFTPNGDGINDFWQFLPPPSGVNPIRELYIFDRFGNLLSQVDPRGAGWDGTWNGRPLPSSDYWFRAIEASGREVRGHFSLKR
ncbi:T9SS type B sorting domain-containing protein [Robiginitalea marina]|uniref:T9SS type B sorting domain-containing protein n=1 Tax=Robiginitalea marina TaxID=2954105 RepID=A0ABT1AWP8_9FLAO|nr:T9SS type B sorting domain-containing protein [Robiginitalea marina]MCO5724032.1 T9SS type B sorting domain-containing protein [Robiginitalea marina]